MYTPIQYHTGGPSQYNKRKEKEKTHRKDKIKPSLLIGDKIIYMEHHKESQKKKKPTRIQSEFSKVAEYQYLNFNHISVYWQ